jgi:hypothetical protein
MSVHDAVRQEMLAIYRESDYRIAIGSKESIMPILPPEIYLLKAVVTFSIMTCKMNILLRAGNTVT